MRAGVRNVDYHGPRRGEKYRGGYGYGAYDADYGAGGRYGGRYQDEYDEEDFY